MSRLHPDVVLESIAQSPVGNEHEQRYGWAGRPPSVHRAGQQLAELCARQPAGRRCHGGLIRTRGVLGERAPVTDLVPAARRVPWVGPASSFAADIQRRRKCADTWPEKSATCARRTPIANWTSYVARLVRRVYDHDIERMAATSTRLAHGGRRRGVDWRTPDGSGYRTDLSY